MSPERFHIVSTILVAAVLSAVVGCAGAQRLAGFGNTRPETPYDNVVSKPCDQVTQDSKKLIREYWEAGFRDSALAAFTYWTDQCGVTDVTYRTNLILRIASGQFNESQLDRWVIENIIRYRHRDDIARYGLYCYYGPPEDQTFGQFTARVAREMLPKLADGSVERLLCECYSGDCDSIFIKLRGPQYDRTRLQQFYVNEVRQVTENRSEGHFALYSGYWMPQGDNEVLGDHPVLGAKMGGKFSGWATDFVGEIRLLDAGEPFVINHNDSVDTTEGYLGYYFGFEVGRELFRTPSHEFQLRVGAGFDGFRYGEVSDQEASQKIHAFNANVGFSYKYYLKPNNTPYIGFEGLYSFMNYERNGGSAVGGNAVEFRVAFGWSGNAQQYERLRDLGYGS